MVTSTQAAGQPFRARGGHFLVGEYSPAHRTSERSPIPARTSAYPTEIANVRARHGRTTSGETSKDFTNVPTMPQPRSIWQYETLHDIAEHVAEHSFEKLSVGLTDTDAILHALPSTSYPVVSAKAKRYAAQRDEHSIIERLRTHDVTIIDTVPPLISHAFGAGAKHNVPLRPGDKLRWWLIRPGRLEFLIWLLGTILLICVTAVLLLLLLSSLGYVTMR